MIYFKLDKNMIKFLFRVIHWLTVEKSFRSIPNVS